MFFGFWNIIDTALRTVCLVMQHQMGYRQHTMVLSAVFGLISYTTSHPFALMPGKTISFRAMFLAPAAVLMIATILVAFFNFNSDSHCKESFILSWWDIRKRHLDLAVTQAILLYYPFIWSVLSYFPCALVLMAHRFDSSYGLIHLSPSYVHSDTASSNTAELAGTKL